MLGALNALIVQQVEFAAKIGRGSIQRTCPVTEDGLRNRTSDSKGLKTFLCLFQENPRKSVRDVPWLGRKIQMLMMPTRNEIK